MKRRPWFAACIALVLLCVGGFALRLRGIGYLLPVFTTLDASVIVHQVEMMHHDTEDPAGDPLFAYYPHLLARAVSLLPEPDLPESGRARGLEQTLLAATAPWKQVRIVSALLSLLAVPATWLLARRFLSGHWPLLAAALVATSLLHVAFTTQERPHGAAASFMLIAVLAALRLLERGGAWSYVLAGIAAGLAAGSLHYGVFALPALGVAFVLRMRRGEGRSGWWILAAIAIVAALFRYFYPFYFVGRPGMLALQDVRGEAAINLSGQPLLLEKFRGRGFVTIFRELWSYDPILLFTALAGAAALVIGFARRAFRFDRARKDALLVILALVVPYVLVIGMYDQTWERFLLPLLPFVAGLGAYGVCRATSALSPPWRTFVATSLPALALVPAIHLGTTRAAPSTFELAARWIDAELEPETDRIGVLGYDLPLLHADEALSANAQQAWSPNWVRYQVRLPESSRAGRRFQLFVSPKSVEETRAALLSDPLGYFRSFGAGYAVLSPSFAQVREAVRANGDRLARFTPAGRDDGPDETYFIRHVDHVFADPFFRFVMRMERMGPTLEVYRLR